MLKAQRYQPHVKIFLFTFHTVKNPGYKARFITRMGQFDLLKLWDE